MVHPIAAGDMYGVLGIDHIARPGLLRRVIAGSYPSGPSKAEPPKVWQMIERDEIEAYNLPSGVLFQMHRAGATGQPGIFSAVGLDTFVDPRQRRRPDERRDQRGHRPGRAARRPGVAVLPGDPARRRRSSAAPRRDESGNITFEDEGSTLGALDQAYAAHNNGGIVIAQVKRLAAAGTLPPAAGAGARDPRRRARRRTPTSGRPPRPSTTRRSAARSAGRST